MVEELLRNCPLLFSLYQVVAVVGQFLPARFLVAFEVASEQQQDQEGETSYHDQPQAVIVGGCVVQKFPRHPPILPLKEG